MVKRLNLEDNSEIVQIGKAIHEERLQSSNSEIAIENIKLDKLTKEESIALGEYEYGILGIPVDNLNLLKKNDDYMTGYMSAMLMNNNSKKHR